MNLEDLVPPLELCKQIPAGEFEDSALLYCVRHGHNGKVFNDIICREDYDWSKTENYPAPTLQEIMAEMPHCICRHSHLGWAAASVYVDNNMPIFESNPATAAMKLWLEVNKNVLQKTAKVQNNRICVAKVKKESEGENE